MATRNTPLFSRFLGNIRKMTVAVAVIFLFFIFFGFKISNGRNEAWSRRWAEWGSLYFKKRKKGKNEDWQ